MPGLDVPRPQLCPGPREQVRERCGRIRCSMLPSAGQRPAGLRAVPSGGGLGVWGAFGVPWCHLGWVTLDSLGGKRGSNRPELALPYPSRVMAAGQR